MNDLIHTNGNGASTADRHPEPALVRRLMLHSPLSGGERDTLAKLLSLDVRHVRSRSPLGDARNPSGKLAVLLEGWACAYRLLAEDKRQLVACYLPGDICDIHGLIAPRLDTVIVLLPGASVARLSRDSMARLHEESPRIVLALWRDAQIASAIEREWFVGLAQRDARTRVAHLLCELLARAEAVGELQGGRLPMPILQADLADACGLTPAHANRVLRTLREDGIAHWHGQSVTVPDRAALIAAADFCPAYLGLNDNGENGGRTRART